MSAPGLPRKGWPWWIIPLVVWSLAAIYAGSHLMRGWVPHDDGAFSESAERVLHGQLPHRDYAEIYTGGLAYLDAFAFRYLGENFATLRIVLFVFFLAWVPAFYWLASRLVPDWVAGSAALLAVAWSLPNYSAAVPSWYNLFFATFGLAALFRYLESQSRHWLFVAGLCGGLSILAKVPGLYYVVAVLLFFVFSEQNVGEKESTEKPRSVLYSVFVTLAVLGLTGALAFLVRNRPSVEAVLDFVVPGAALAALVLLRELRARTRPDRERFAELFRMCGPFVLGMLFSLFPFLLLYRTPEALQALANGLFVLPFKRFQFAFVDPPLIGTVVPSLCLIGLLALGAWLRGIARWLVCLAAGALAAFYIISSAQKTGAAQAIRNVENYQTAWHTAYWLTPCVVLAGALVLWKRNDLALADALWQKKLFLTLAVLSLCSLVQCPFAAPIYFCYISPLVILAAVAVLRLFPNIPKPLLGIVLAGFLLFAVFRLTPPFIYVMGYFYQPNPETQVLDLPRAGNLRVDRESLITYKRLIPLIKEHAGKEEIYAAPDCPEVYFLAGYSNPTAAPFQMFDEHYHNGQQILDLLDHRNIRLVVINSKPGFSPIVAGDLRVALFKRFPNEEHVGKFLVRWRN